MKNLKMIFVLSILMFSLLIGVNNSSAATLATTLKGRILLQVEQNGEAWYVNPVNELRYYLGRPADAFNVMRELGLGISNKDFDSFNGYAPSRLSGRILLKVADSGKAYYVNTNDLKMYYLGRPADAFNVMRELGLGITDKNLSLISMANNETANWQTYKDIKNGFEFKYPQDATFVSGDKPAGMQNNIVVSVENINNAKDLPSGFNKENYIKDIAALKKGDASNPFSWGQAYESLNIPGALGKKFMVTQAFEACSVLFNQDALIYKDNNVINLTFYNNSPYDIAAKNLEYFTFDKSSCNNYAWKSGNSFIEDLVSGKTDSSSQKWYKDFNLILSTFKFTN